jgi:hypothetical protein
MKIYHIIVLFVVVFLISACDSKTANSKNESSKRDALNADSVLSNADFLIYYEEIKGVFNCMKKELPNGKVSLVASFNTKPLDVIWDTEEKLAYFVTKKGVFKKKYIENDRFDCISDSLPIFDDYELGECWIDNKTNKIRISYGIYDSNFDERLRDRMDNYMNDSTNNFYDFGVNMFACIAELSPKGKWKVIEEKESTGGACDTPGLTVLMKDIHRKNKMTSTGHSIEVSNCLGGIMYLENDMVTDLDSTQLKYYFKNKKLPIDVEGYYKVHVNDKFDFIVSAVWFSSPTYTCPLYLYDKSNRKMSELPDVKKNLKIDENAGLTIQNTTRYTLIGKDYYNSSPMIYDPVSFKLIGFYPKAISSFILEQK